MKKSPSRADLILHPVRIQITAALSLKDATPKQLAEYLGDVAVSSLYRHLNVLLEGDVIEVARSEQIGSVEEKTYRLKVSETFTAADITTWTPEDYESYFTAAVLSIIASMKRYIKLESNFEKVKDLSIWQGHTLSISDTEWEEALAEIQSVLAKYRAKDTGPKTREIYLISHPLKEEL